MRCKDIFDKIENWAPREIAWDGDNAGLQVGSADREVKKLLLTLDLTEPAIDKAVEQNCSLILTHHPLLFNPLRKIDTYNDRRSRLIEKLIKNDITLYSAHTNLDYTSDGVSFELASVLRLKNIRFLLPLQGRLSKVVVFAPLNVSGKIAQAVFDNGGGIIGEYSECSFSSTGKGTFRGSEKSDPAVGNRGKFETVDEVRFEVITDEWKLDRILEGIKKVHPYEEPAFDIYPLNNRSANFGIGATGELAEPLDPREFLDYLSAKLNIKEFRYSAGGNGHVNKVAVCGGSGSEYLNDAIKSGSDAFITADVKYHTFQEAEGKIMLVDAGHYESEVFALDAVARYLRGSFGNIEVLKFTDKVNPVIFYNK